MRALSCKHKISNIKLVLIDCVYCLVDFEKLHQATLM